MSKDEKNLDPSQLRDLFFIDAEGNLRWKRREWATRAWNSRCAGKIVGSLMPKGYRNCSLMGGTFLVHRIVWALETGNWPRGQIDHINGVRFDNRISNLRDVSALENQRNAGVPRTNTSGVLGVAYREEKKRWRAYISDRNKSVHLGYFDTREEAILARKNAEAQRGFHKNHGSARCLY